MNISSEDLRRERLALFRKAISTDSFYGLYNVQIDIANAIIKAEHKMEKAKSSILEFHIERLRLYVDTTVWRFIHPHAIRQLAKNPSTRIKLSEQGQGFNRVIDLAHTYVKALDVPVFICDLTNVLNIGDIIVVLDRESPTIVEVKNKLPDPKKLMQGRIGRQISRASKTSKYLDQGSGQLFGGELRMEVVETKNRRVFNWDPIRDLCQRALKNGHAISEVSEFELISAFVKDVDLETKSQEISISEEGLVFLGTSLALNQMDEGVLFPIGIWQIPPDIRFVLLEEELILLHILKSPGLEDRKKNGDSIQITKSSYPVNVTIQGENFPLSNHFVYDVLYNFETVESYINGAYEFAEGVKKALVGNAKESHETAKRKPEINNLASKTEIKEILVDRSISKDDFISINPKLLLSVDQSDGKIIPKTYISDISGNSLIIITLAELRKIISSSN